MKVKSSIRVGVILALLVLLAFACAGPSKIQRIAEQQMSATLSLPRESDIPELEYRAASRDTIIVKDESGKDIILMKAIKDEMTGEMVANEVLDAAIVTARFRNIAERRGKVDLQFQITVPKDMQDRAWQLRFYPDMFIMEDSLRLESVVITGDEYRKEQLRGYEQYEKFLSKIVNDESKFVDVKQLEIFLERHIPIIFAYKTDTSFVSDAKFYSYYGVSEQEALKHYTNHAAKRRNQRRINSKDKMFHKYVKAPIVTENIRLDTVITSVNGDIVYNYTQTINTRPKLRKVDIRLSGEIYEQDQRLYQIPFAEPLTFYISSLSSFTDLSERYLQRVIERRAQADASYRIAFQQGRSEILTDLDDNEAQIDFVKENLVDLLNNDVYDLDSIVFVANASPEGSWALNDVLSKRRGESVVKYFEQFVKEYRRQLEREAGFGVDEEGNVINFASKIPNIRFKSRSVPENWTLLDRLVREDLSLTDDQKERYFSHEGIRDKDRREAVMKGDSYYPYLRDTLYRRLRVVDAAFHLHRKGMLKDTVHTTELDEHYMRGVQLLKDMDYEEAVKILGPYQDYNAAVAYMAAERNASALLILDKLEKTPAVNYLLAIVYSRTGRHREAVQCYMNACNQDQSYVHRGNLDPEISVLIKMYGLNKQEEEDDLGY